MVIMPPDKCPLRQYHTESVNETKHGQPDKTLTN